ncbi:VOC family protein [Saccharicrinis aurantiacus]|uniref:VOC family protein n=1 Tax=Saccharicrinis aurantiacus TaxID=1849719 RepID=UPI0024920147|nr:VOC family protein [Saccharicrinis aurantiacus]
MATINVYLTFNGNCREAFTFYKTVFNKDFEMISTFGEMPPMDGVVISDDEKDKIMHVSLSISKETVLMGSDVGGGWSTEVTVGDNFAISLSVDSKEEADAFFNQLSTEGKIGMPMADTFWESYFGMCTDKFGINWMISTDKK